MYSLESPQFSKVGPQAPSGVEKQSRRAKAMASCPWWKFLLEPVYFFQNILFSSEVIHCIGSFAIHLAALRCVSCSWFEFHFYTNQLFDTLQPSKQVHILQTHHPNNAKRCIIFPGSRLLAHRIISPSWMRHPSPSSTADAPLHQHTLCAIRFHHCCSCWTSRGAAGKA